MKIEFTSTRRWHNGKSVAVGSSLLADNNNDRCIRALHARARRRFTQKNSARAALHIIAYCSRNFKKHTTTGPARRLCTGSRVYLDLHNRVCNNVHRPPSGHCVGPRRIRRRFARRGVHKNCVRLKTRGAIKRRPFARELCGFTPANRYSARSSGLSLRAALNVCYPVARSSPPNSRNKPNRNHLLVLLLNVHNGTSINVPAAVFFFFFV